MKTLDGPLRSASSISTRRVTAIKLSDVGAGHARDVSTAVAELQILHRGHGPLLRCHCD